jgi:hypothetical protein
MTKNKIAIYVRLKISIDERRDLMHRRAHDITIYLYYVYHYTYGGKINNSSLQHQQECGSSVGGGGGGKSIFVCLSSFSMYVWYRFIFLTPLGCAFVLVNPRPVRRYVHTTRARAWKLQRLRNIYTHTHEVLMFTHTHTLVYIYIYIYIYIYLYVYCLLPTTHHLFCCGKKKKKTEREKRLKCQFSRTETRAIFV